MAFTFNINQEAAVATQRTGALASGIHLVTIEEAWLGETANGNNTIDLVVADKSGAKATIFGMCIDEKFSTGSDNISFGVWNELAIVCGMQTGAVAPGQRKDFNGAITTENAFVELIGKPFTIGLQIIHDVNKDETKEIKRRSLYRAFYADGRSVSEVQAGETVAKNSSTLVIEDYVNAKCEALRARMAGGAAPMAAGVAPVAAVAPIVAPVAAPIPVAPVAVAPVAPAVAPAPLTVTPTAVPVAAVAQPVAAAPVTPVQPAAAVAAAMPVNPALAGQF